MHLHKAHLKLRNIFSVWTKKTLPFNLEKIPAFSPKGKVIISTLYLVLKALIDHNLFPVHLLNKDDNIQKIRRSDKRPFRMTEIDKQLLRYFTFMSEKSLLKKQIIVSYKNCSQKS